MYPYVKAYHDYGARKGPALGFVVHMAEGGGTVGFLSRPNPRGVSVHYVIERTGRVVQMLRETRASGSINPTDIRRTDDPDGFYGVTDAQAVLGEWWRDPNSAVITVEVEGFAKDGPNVVQAAALEGLVADVRSRFPTIGLLGHRDFTIRKACPGRKIDWEALGGHGVYDPGPPAPTRTYRMVVAPGAVVRQYLRLTPGGRIQMHYPDGSPAWLDSTWGRAASSAPCERMFRRHVVDQPDSVTVRTTTVRGGTYDGHVVRVGAAYGVGVVAIE